MTVVGIIANPAAGRDIRRLVAHASVFDNNEKVNIVRRVLMGLEAVGVRKAWIMPDAYGIGRKALDALRLNLEVRFVEMSPRFEEGDSVEAAARMVEAGARTLITLGGDGTNRAVAKACGAIPLMPISTGTNNAFPVMVEGTLAGLAAGLTAMGVVPLEVATTSTKRIDLWRGGTLEEIALVDAVVYRERFIASRAVWRLDEVKMALFTRAEPWNIGLSAIGGYLEATPLAADEGLYVEMGEGGCEVLAPVAPGVIHAVKVAAHRRVRLGERIVVVDCAPALIALDGERKVTLKAGEPIELCVTASGPRVIEIRRTLSYAAAVGAFIRESLPTDGKASRSS
ncbi:ATP-NAD kinase family protein [Caldilinea sp.]|uniref:ATP-NAD kinase family protein n=1 Tax=Caldilinea sp. TaxID=2293560 RepID=UPI0021DD0DC9|nr:NAD(+)/NADH kinase [Caldilinea sp.]GIV70387.1 MAG: ATP-NAD kinase [Caldilinea sp.]